MKFSQSNTSNLKLDDNIQNLYKTKSKNASKLNDVGIQTISNLINIFPNRYEVILPCNSYKDFSAGQFVRLYGEVISSKLNPSNTRGKYRQARLYNLTLTVRTLNSRIFNLTWFNLYPNLANSLKDRDSIQVYGKLDFYFGQLQMANPDIISAYDEMTPFINKIYPTINGVSPKDIANLISRIPINLFNAIPDEIPEELRIKRKLDPINLAYKTIHALQSLPQTFNEDLIKAKQRILYEEFFIDQVKIDIRKRLREDITTESIVISNKFFSETLEKLPHKPTESQLEALKSIKNDLNKSIPMNRLLQGDVGSGKTMVAMATVSWVISQGYQAAIMAPTESLALQLFNNFKDFLGNDLTIRAFGLLAKDKKKLFARSREMKPAVFIGTQSLLNENLEFSNLGLLIIDEQHKFGVKQRTKLYEKYNGIHSLIMTATPIPRTLQISLFGHLDVSNLETFNKKLSKRSTKIINNENFKTFLSFLKTRIEMGEQAYIVVGAIFNNPEQDIKDLEQVFAKFTNFFPKFKIGKLHGSLSSQEKEITLNQFKEGHFQLLICTSVIEVGIDIHNATTMAIFNPERFGLSTLHQLRGRVGRGSKPGFCFLVCENNLSTNAIERLKFIENCDDGFKISEFDMQNRGAGDIFGTDQSGYSEDKLTKIQNNRLIFDQASEDFKSLTKEVVLNIENQLSQKKLNDCIISSI